MTALQSGGRAQGSGNVEQTAKQWLTGGQKWLKSAGKKLATAAKESASEIQKRLETVDVKMQKGVCRSLINLSVTCMSCTCMSVTYMSCTRWSYWAPQADLCLPCQVDWWLRLKKGEENLLHKLILLYN